MARFSAASVSAGARHCPGRSSLDNACAPAVTWQLTDKRDSMISQIEVSTLPGEPRRTRPAAALATRGAAGTGSNGFGLWLLGRAHDDACTGRRVAEPRGRTAAAQE